MVKNLKISIALLLGTVFVFRVLFVNIGIISSLNVQQNGSFVKAYFSTTMKKRRHVEVLNKSRSCEYSMAEVYEENPDNDDQLKSNSFFLIQVLYSVVAGEAE